MKEELPCMAWLGEQNKEALLLQLEGLHYATGLSYDDLINQFTYYKDTFHLYTNIDITPELFASLNQEPTFFCENNLSVPVSDFVMSPCSLCPYSDNFKNARVDKECQLLYSLFDGTISVGNFKPDKVSTIFVSEHYICDGIHAGKWPVVPLYSMLYNAYQFAYITSGPGTSISIKDAEKLFFESGNYSQFMPLFADACKRDIADIERAFSDKIKQFIDGYTRITSKAAIILMSELEISYKRCCSAYRKEHGIVRLQIRKRNLQKHQVKGSLSSESSIEKEKYTEEKTDTNNDYSAQQTLFSTELLDAMSSSLKVEKKQLFTNEILSPKDEKTSAGSKNNGRILPDSPQTPVGHMDNCAKECNDSDAIHSIESDKTSANSSELLELFPATFTPLAMDFCHIFKLEESEMLHKDFTVLTPFTVPGFEVLIHKETSCGMEIVYWNDMISFLAYFPISQRYYLIPTSFITGGLQYLLKNMNYIYTFHAPLLMYCLQYFSLKHQCVVVDIPFICAIIHPEVSDFSQCLFDLLCVPKGGADSISCLLECGLSFMIKLVESEFKDGTNQKTPILQNNFDFYSNLNILEELMMICSLTFYDGNGQGQYCSLLQREGHLSYSLKDYQANGYVLHSGFTVRLWADNSFQTPTADVTAANTKNEDSRNTNTALRTPDNSLTDIRVLMSWSDRLCFYIQGLRVLCRQNIFYAYNGHLLKLDEQGILLHFECENADSMTDVLWNVFSTIYYKSYQDTLLLHVTVKSVDTDL